jgi:hypothetical protein
MAIKKPLVITNGQIEQLQAGDSLANPNIALRLNQSGSTINVCMPVYADGNGTVAPALADAIGTSQVVGLMTEDTANNASGGVQTEGFFTANTSEWDAVAGTTGGLTAGTRYYVDPTTAGNITATAPTADGDIVAPIGVGASTTELEISIQTTVRL